MRTASWVIRDRETKAAILETFSRAFVERVDTAKYEAVPIMQYLQELNRSIAASKA
ncbi:hypothetical protein [Rhizobium azibense]|uniref:hypothetical protein n=1 Tax=Rhizobium azibense TaxID=1136135 RepID=UPI00140468E7|nr:hypothetical protein [Rhizobium azibense]